MCSGGAIFNSSIEEQARLSCHAHLVFHFVNRQSQAWLRAVLRKETPEARTADDHRVEIWRFSGALTEVDLLKFVISDGAAADLQPIVGQLRYLTDDVFSREEHYRILRRGEPGRCSLRDDHEHQDER